MIRVGSQGHKKMFVDHKYFIIFLISLYRADRPSRELLLSVACLWVIVKPRQ